MERGGHQNQWGMSPALKMPVATLKEKRVKFAQMQIHHETQQQNQTKQW